jgi:hydrogenase nickel incorporation protein HypB
MFRAADLVLLTKTDLTPVMEDFDPARAEQAIRNLANGAPIIPLSARKAINLAPWLAWLRNEVATIRQETARERQGARHGHHLSTMA